MQFIGWERNSGGLQTHVRFPFLAPRRSGSRRIPGLPCCNTCSTLTEIVQPRATPMYSFLSRALARIRSCRARHWSGLHAQLGDAARLRIRCRPRHRHQQRGFPSLLPLTHRGDYAVALSSPAAPRAGVRAACAAHGGAAPRRPPPDGRRSGRRPPRRRRRRPPHTPARRHGGGRVAPPPPPSMTWRAAAAGRGAPRRGRPRSGRDRQRFRCVTWPAGWPRRPIARAIRSGTILGARRRRKYTT